MSTRLFAPKIAHGFSSEARVFASLLRHTSSDVETCIAYHERASSEDGDALAFEQAAGRTVHRLDTGWRSNSGRRQGFKSKIVFSLRFYLALRKMERLAKDSGAQVVYSSQQKWDCTAATYVAKKLGIPQIIHLHYNIGPWLGQLPRKRLMSCEKVITVSDFISGEALSAGIDPQNVVAIRNTIEQPFAVQTGDRNAVRAELKLPLDATVAGMVARVEATKGQMDALRAFEAVAA